jgi:hypothetical protein
MIVNGRQLDLRKIRQLLRNDFPYAVSVLWPEALEQAQYV